MSHLSRSISRSGLGLAAAAGLIVSGFAVASAAPNDARSNAAQPQTCTSVVPTLGQSQGAAGSTYQTIRFTNKGSSACSLPVHPGVWFANVNKIMVGWPALHESGAQGGVQNETSPTFVLPVGRYATAVVQIPDYGNFPPADCIAVKAPYLRVGIPGKVGYLPWNKTECTTKYARSSVSPLKLAA